MATDLDSFLATMLNRSRLPIERAVALVREHYGLETSAVPLTGERDENFRLSAPDGAEYVLKIANPSEPPELTDLFSAALRHVESVDPAFPCPRVVRDRGGSCQVRFTDESGAERTARVLTWLRGRLLGAASRSRQQRCACGRLGGRLSVALRSFRHPAAHRALIWDLRQVAHVSRLLDQLPDLRRRGEAADLLRRCVPRIEARWPGLRRQIVHNDLNPRNILVDPADEVRVTGIIDFGDVTHTALIADVAVTAAELLPEDCGAHVSSACEAIRDVATAYHESVPLLPEELAVLGSLVAARLIMNVVVPEWHRHRNPAGGHYAAPDPDFIAARLELARELSLQEIGL